MMLLRVYGCTSRLYASPEPVPRLVPCWLCRSGCGTHQNTYFPASCTRKYTRVPTPVPCCSAMPYRTYTPLTPPTPPRSPPGACVVAYAACDKKIQNQDFSFDPPRTPLSYTPLSFAAGGREGSNPKCNVCQNYSPGEHAVWQAVEESVKEGRSACPDELWKLHTRAQRVRARGRSNCIRPTPTKV